MSNIFIKEDGVVQESEKLILAHTFESTKDEKHYEHLLDEYKHLLNQVKHMVRMSDLMGAKLKSVSSKLDKMSKTDFLTGLYNRRFFDEFYLREWQGTMRTSKFLSILIVDIDHFKEYNDTYGHLLGDKCLQAVAYALKTSIKRPRDFIARFGGEEFVCLLPETDMPGAQCVARRFLSRVEAIEVPLENQDGIVKATVSIGVSSLIPSKEISPNDFLQAADDALYIAKGEGRNCIRQKNIVDCEKEV